MTGGVEVGYDLESTGFVFGPEASILWSGAKYCTAIYGDDRGCLRMGREIEVGGRLGHRFTDSGTIGYLKIAYVNGRGRLTYADGDPEDHLSLHDDRSGIRFGVGIEQPIGRRVYVKGEYRYTNFKNYKYDDGEQRASLGFDRHQVIGGVGVRF
ncbi:outer membrane protein [Sphingomonas oryzagri]